MRLVRHWDTVGSEDHSRVVTLGNFDGVHRGHRAIVHRCVEQAREMQGIAVGVTFDPHPVARLRPDKAPPLLCTLRQRIVHMGKLGLDAIVLQHFTRAFSEVSAEDFVTDYLVARLRARYVVVGHNFGFGHGRRGDVDFLRSMGERLGFRVEVVGPIRVGDRVVSSTKVRDAVARGALDEAGDLLGRPFRIGGRVARGERRGHALGFPTANLRTAGLQVPPDGVYAVQVLVGERRFPGVANLGVKPTFGVNERMLEAHIFDHDEDLYGRWIAVEPVRHIRGERRFPDVDALVRQVRADMQTARRILAA